MILLYMFLSFIKINIQFLKPEQGGKEIRFLYHPFIPDTIQPLKIPAQPEGSAHLVSDRLRRRI
jgi:hypothetical protein